MTALLPAVQDDVQELADNLREGDLAELLALSRQRPLDAVQRSFDRSERRWTVRDDDGRMVCMAGFADVSILGDVGAPWLLATPLLNEHAKELVRMSRRIVRVLITYHYQVLWNVVWAENKRSIRYLSALGFRLGPQLTAPTGARYHEFRMERGDAACAT